MREKGDRSLIHFTTKEEADAIAASGKIGGQWGIHAIAADRRPRTLWWLRVATLKTFCGVRHMADLAEVTISRDTSKAFRRPVPVGPFSLLRWAAGVYATDLGSIDTVANEFIPNEIGMRQAPDTGPMHFRGATRIEAFRAASHRWVLDYFIDFGIFVIAAGVGLYVGVF